VSRLAVRTGLDRVVEAPGDHGLLGRRAALLGHPASVTSDFIHAADALLASGVNLVRLFGPEHGLRGEAQYMEAVGHEVDPLTGIESVSLYGAHESDLRPTPAQLAGIDVVVVDLQDVGSRYYTYVYSALFMAEECHRAGIECVVLDRPNPLGAAVEGGHVERSCRSFVGWLDMPTRHGLTLAEVLRLARAAGHQLAPRIVPVEGWQRHVPFDETTAPWVLPSPNMPTVETAWVYPGMCLLEGTNISEGRGTTRPFELFGAPYIDANRLGRLLESVGLPGVRFRPCAFTPTFDKFKGERCFGLQLHVTDRSRFEALKTGAAIVWAVSRLWPDDFRWRTHAYEFVEDVPAIDLLFGTPVVRGLIDAGAPFADVAAALATPTDLARAVTAARLAAYGSDG
jgi:uncharacterized protein YbbC (DUF1343 family)